VKAVTLIFFVLKERKRLPPHLRLETVTPTETDKAITTLEQENKELKDQIENLETTMQKIYQKVFHEKIELEEQKKWEEKWEKEHPEQVERLERQINEHVEAVREEEYLAKNPEERKRREQQEKNLIAEYVKQLEEHSEDIER